MVTAARRSLEDEPAWPASEGKRLVFLLDASSALEMELLESWIRRHQPQTLESTDFDVVALPPTRRRRPDASLDCLEEKLRPDDDALLAPLRVAWLASERHGKRIVRFKNLLTLGDPRDPSPWRQTWILRTHPDRCRIVAGEPAPASELRTRWKKTGALDTDSIKSLARFVARQAALACERTERHLRGARYKVPRLVFEDIVGQPGFRSAAARIARESGRSETDVMQEASRNLREISATHSPFVIDLVAPLIRRLYTQGYDKKLHYDRAQLDRLMELGKRHPLVMLPSHKSHLDHLVLQYMLYENGHPPNHAAGGINMNFFPLGPLARRSGVFFIRRRFRDDAIYKFVLRSYIDYLIEKRFALEWYIEGSRSRSGKLLPPRFGLLAYVIDAYRRAKSEDVLLVPISIAYDQIQDVNDYAAEQTGAKKTRESFGWMVARVRALRRRYGSIQIRFGEPLSLAKLMGPADPDAAPEPDEQSIAVQKVAFEVADRINQVTPITPTSLVTLALLERGDRAVTVAEAVTAVGNLYQYVQRRNLPLTSSAELSDLQHVQATLEALVENHVASRFDGGLEPVYQIGAKQQLTASYYRNTVIHFFVNTAIVELALLRAGECDAGDATEAFWDEAMRLRDLLKFEFFFANKEIYHEQLRRELELQAPDWEGLLREGSHGIWRLVRSFRPFISHRVLRPFLDAYRVVGEHLERWDPARPIDEKPFINEAIRLGHQYHLQGTVHSAASVSQVLMKNALRLADNRALLEPGGAEQEKARGAFASEIRHSLRRVEAIQALAVSRRAGLIE